MQVRQTHQNNKYLDEELRREKALRETSNSKLTGELNKAKEELQKAQDKLKLFEVEFQEAKDGKKQAEN